MINPTPGISAIVIVYNEEKMIERCLQSLAGVVDEIILIHDGECKDNTLSLARKYTDKIYVESRMGIAELHHIKALEYACYSWILRIDADEYLSEALRKELGELIKDERYDMYAFIWPMWNGAAYTSKGLPYKDALFRREKASVVEFPAKTYFVNGVRKKVPLVLEHRPNYDNFTWNAFKNKWVKWIKVQAMWTCQHENVHFYNCTPEQIQAFHKNMEKQIRYAHPLLMPGWFFLSFTKFLFRLKVWSNSKTMPVAFFQGLYAAGLCYDIWQRKNMVEK
jgi:glycosyltransferase involved in cell wall biosynthesis